MTAIKSFLKTILFKPLFNALVYLMWLFPGDSVGLAIISLTIIIRILLLPANAKAIESQKKLKDLQPEIDKIREKYKGNQQEQAKATMEFYQQNKINPFGSCLPVLIQLPILIILYYVFRTGLNTDRFEELLYSFTPHPETINTFFLGIDLSQPSIYLAVLAGILQFFQTRQMMPKEDPKKKDDKQNALQSMLGKQMMYMMPVLTVIISFKLPAALPLYWVITTIFMIIQQQIILKKKNNKEKKGVTVKIKSNEK